jgi:murein DD-endopeptidase MepM/ murein hydrolase activator NlpD
MKLKMKRYTVFIISPNASETRKLILSSWFLRLSLFSLVLVLAVFSWILCDYFTQTKKKIVLQELLSLNRSQRNEIQFFHDKFSSLEDEIKRLQTTEAQVKKDWQDIKELSKKTKMTPVPLARKERRSDKEDKISVLDEFRPERIRRLHQDLLFLRKKALFSENSLDELNDTLHRQKSVLLATPTFWPVLGRITSVFGETRYLAASGGTKPHKGIDLAVPTGTPILAPAPGIVVQSEFQPDYGNMVYLDHGHGMATKYGHLQKIYVKRGETVQKGEVMEP